MGSLPLVLSPTVPPPALCSLTQGYVLHIRLPAPPAPHGGSPWWPPFQDLSLQYCRCGPGSWWREWSVWQSDSDPQCVPYPTHQNPWYYLRPHTWISRLPYPYDGRFGNDRKAAGGH